MERNVLYSTSLQEWSIPDERSTLWADCDLIINLFPWTFTNSFVDGVSNISDGYNIVVVEAAVLLEAGWDKQVHEVWTTFVPKEEVGPLWLRWGVFYVSLIL